MKQKLCFEKNAKMQLSSTTNIVAKNPILNVADFLNPSLETTPCTKTSPTLYENQYFFSYYFWMWSPLSKLVFFCYFLQYYGVILSSFLDGSYWYIVFIDPDNGYSKPKLLLFKSKFRFRYVCLL